MTLANGLCRSACETGRSEIVTAIKVPASNPAVLCRLSSRLGARCADGILSNQDTRCRVRFLFLLSGLLALWLVLHPGGPKITAEAGSLGETALIFLGAGWCFAAARRKDLGQDIAPGRRATSALLGLGVVCAGIGQCVRAYAEIALPQPPLFPVWAEAGFLAPYPLLLWGILRLPTQPLPAAQRGRVALDTLITLTSLLTFSWYFVLGPTIQQGAGVLLGRCWASACPLGDLLLLISLLLVMAQRWGAVPQLAAAALAAGLTSLLIVDTTLTWHPLRGTAAAGAPVTAGWPLGFLLIGLAAGLARRPSPASVLGGGGDDPAALPLLWRSLRPYALMPFLAALTVYARLHHGDEALETGVCAGVGFQVVLVLARQAVAIQRLIADLRERIAELEEARHHLTALAEQDALTGLFNHRVFHKRLREETSRAERTGRPLTVVLTDLDNFKFFNDAYGHMTGDDVLRQVASALGSCCRAEDTLARFGGDEFALLLPGVAADEACGIAERLQDVLNALGYRPPEHDAEIPLRLSVGTATFPLEGERRLDILALADSRLARAKTGGADNDDVQRLRLDLTHSVEGFSMLNALLAAVDNKDRYTAKHSEDVMAFSLQIAAALGLDEAMQHIIAVAALLHDVGKIGVPDAILRKPGHLTDEEYAAVQHHPMMGAVLVGSVPGFAEVLDAIRYHHERWDGEGYPFGLRGEETPLLARLMAVADAFSAMTTDRPYRKGMPEAVALAEIEGGAGSQFDPALAQLFVNARRGVAPPRHALLDKAA